MVATVLKNKIGTIQMTKLVTQIVLRMKEKSGTINLMNVLVMKMITITGVMTSKCVYKIVTTNLVMITELMMLLVNVQLVLMMICTMTIIWNGVFLIVAIKLILTIMMIFITKIVFVKMVGLITVIIVHTKQNVVIMPHYTMMALTNIVHVMKDGKNNTILLME